jgi:predicted transcriptional regulator
MTSPTPPDPLPDELGGPLEKLVYLYVRERGGASIYDLRDALDVPQLKLYPTLETLAERDLVEHRGDEVSLPEPRQLARA